MPIGTKRRDDPLLPYRRGGKVALQLEVDKGFLGQEQAGSRLATSWLDPPPFANEGLHKTGRDGNPFLTYTPPS